jgi:voltage-gated potassium channel
MTTEDTKDSTTTPRWRQRLLQHRFVVMLVLLSLFLTVLPFLRALNPAHQRGFFAIISAPLFIGILLSAVFAISRTRMTLTIAVVLGIPAVIMEFLSHGSIPVSLQFATDILQGGLLTYCVALIAMRLFEIEEVTFDNICASVCAYILLALTWSLVYQIIERQVPGSFLSGGIAIDGFSTTGNISAVYFSMVTISTLGYGDIVPASQQVRLLASCEAITGQIYLAVLVARLVGLHIAHARAQRILE